MQMQMNMLRCRVLRKERKMNVSYHKYFIIDGGSTRLY